MIMIQHPKNVITWCYDINLMILCVYAVGVQYAWVYELYVTFPFCKGLTKHECYKALICNKTQRTYSNKLAMGYHRMAVYHCRINGKSS